MFRRNLLSPLVHKDLESVVSLSTYAHVRLHVKPGHTHRRTGRCMLCTGSVVPFGLWCREEWQGAENKINLLFLTMCRSVAIDKSM
jgi:hypothetical protein